MTELDTLAAWYKDQAARRTVISLTFNNKDITVDLDKYLISLKYTDNESSQADDIDITLDDRDGIWLNNWLNEEVSGEGLKGHLIGLGITQKSFSENGQDKSVYCGSFELDTVNPKGPPATVTLKASSILSTAKIKNEKHSHQWEGDTLETIGKEIATRAGYKFFYDTKSTQTFKRIEQSQEADLPFLEKLCIDSGLSLKVSDQTIIIFDACDYEAAEPIKTISKSMVATYDFKAETADKAYTKCIVKYTSPVTGKTIEGSYPPDNEEASSKTKKKTTDAGETLNITNEKVDSKQAAIELAKKRLRQKNKREFNGNIDIAGDIDLAAGLCVILADFGAFSGKYIITQAKHSITGGYTTALELRKCIDY